MIRNGLSSLIRAESDIHVVDTASNGLEAIAAVQNREIDVVLMDIMMPEMNGVQATKAILADYPEVKVLAVTINDEPRFIKEVLAAGASGYILKHSTKQEILTAIRDVAEGKRHFGAEVLSKISNEFADVSNLSGPILSKKETAVLKLIAQEYDSQEIATELECAVRTVDTHKRNLIKKLEVKNVVGLVKYALKMGLVKE